MGIAHQAWRVTPTGIAVTASAVYWTNRGDGSVWAAAKDGSNARSLVTAPVPDHAGEIAVDAQSVYFLDPKTAALNTVPSDGGAVVTLATGHVFAYAIAVHSTGVYWSDDFYTWATPFDGGSSTPIVQMGDVEGLAIDGQWIYGAPHSAQAHVWRVAPDGGAFSTVSTQARSPRCLAVDATSVYWINLGTMGQVETGSVVRVPKP